MCSPRCSPTSRTSNHFQAGTPETVRRVLHRCLERDPRRRMRDIGDARIIFDDLIAGRGDFGPQASAVDPALIAPLWRWALPWVVGLVGLAAGIAGLLRVVSRHEH